MTFRTTIQLEGKTATGFRVPPAVVEALGRGRRPPVVVTIGGYSYRTTIAPFADGTFMVPLAAVHREAAAVAAGEAVEVDLVLDTEPRIVEAPSDLAAALDAAPEAAGATWDRLSNTDRKYYVLQVEGTKNPETRARRIERAIAALAEGRAR